MHYMAPSLMVLSILLVVDLAGAASVTSGRTIRLGLASALNARQAPTVPPQCKSDCDVVNDRSGEACVPAQCCKVDFETSYFNCLQCVGAAAHFTDFRAAQLTLDALVEDCSTKGFSLPKLTLPGQNPDRLLSTMSAPSTVPTPSPSVLVSSNSVSIISEVSSLISPASINPSSASIISSSGSSINPVLTPVPSPTPTVNLPTTSAASIQAVSESPAPPSLTTAVSSGISSKNIDINIVAILLSCISAWILSV